MESNKFSRRDFLKFSSSTLLVGSTQVPTIALADSSEEDERVVRVSGFSILQGLTTNDSTQLTVDVPTNMKVSYRLIDSDTNQFMPAYYNWSETRSYSDWRVDKLGYEGLRCPGRYIFQVVDQKGHVLDERFLKTLDLEKRDTRVAILSCMLDFSLVKNAMWKSLNKAKPDILFFIGDNVYGDMGLVRGPKLLWNRYLWTRRSLPFYKWKELVPVIATWDDHDFGQNDAGGRYRHKSNSADTFQTFFAQMPRDNALFAGPGIASVFKAFGQQFVFADNRTDRRLPSFHGGNALLGDEQIDWTFKTLRPEDGPVWFLQGTQTFTSLGHKHGEPYETNFVQEWDVFRKNLSGLGVPVVFGSGDVHFSEIMKLGPEYLGYETYELTSSAMHSFPPMRRPQNKRRTHAVFRENYFIIDLVPSTSELVFDVACQGWSEKLYFKESLVIG